MNRPLSSAGSGGEGGRRPGEGERSGSRGMRKGEWWLSMNLVAADVSPLILNWGSLSRLTSAATSAKRFMVPMHGQSTSGSSLGRQYRDAPAQPCRFELDWRAPLHTNKPVRICVIFNPTARGERAKRFRRHLDSIGAECALKGLLAAEPSDIGRNSVICREDNAWCDKGNASSGALVPGLQHVAD